MAEKELEGAQAQELGAAKDLGKVMQDFENDRVELLKNVLGALLLPHPAHMRRTRSRIGAMCSLIW